MELHHHSIINGTNESSNNSKTYLGSFDQFWLWTGDGHFDNAVAFIL